ncbi:MAG: diguanylate cyclase [Ruminococcus sp.]|nr:diguanylate cyclase [Ruminococcus sp.]
MKNFAVFADALEYIEENLCEEISQQDIADACCCSLSSLQKIWRLCTHTSIKSYISRRRLACCAKELLKGELTVTEIAFMYQYNSPEVFARAFRKMWGVAPSGFSKKWKNADLFPPIVPEQVDEGGIYMGRRVDLSELYDFLRSKAGTYVICFDVVGLMPVNENYGSEAGDEVILEAYRRIDQAAGEDMAVFRIGGDEFAMITGADSPEAAEQIADRVLSRNGETISAAGAELPVSLRAGAVMYEQNGFRYSDLFARLQRTVDAARDTNKLLFI